MTGFVLSNLTSLARTILTARVFGADAALDAFNAAQRLPDILFMLVAGGALASAFIPTVTEFLERGDRAGAWRLSAAIINLVFSALLVISLLAWVFAGPLVAATTQFDAAQQVLTVELLRIILISPVIFGISGIFMALLNTHQRFWLPALAPTMYWGGMIAGLVFLTPTMGIHGLAWGAVLGAVLHFGVQLPGVLRLPGRAYRLTFGLEMPAVREVGRLMAPRLLGVAVVQINFLVNVLVGSGLPAGSLSAIDYAFRIMTMPQVVIAQAISIAALPTFSAQVARGALGDMRSSLTATLRGILFLSLPATMGLILLRQPVIELLYQRGQFSAADTELVAWALLWFTVGLVGHSLVEILSRAFYALHDTRTPVMVGVGAMSLNVLFSFTFPAWFMSLGWAPLGGLALANSLATALEMMVLLILMRRRLAGLHERHLLFGAGKSMLATTLMGTAVLGFMAAFPGLSIWFSVPIAIGLGGGLYAGAMLLLRVEEAQALLNALTRRLARVS
jgi:putative peptidoglycan lipid II flippase